MIPTAEQFINNFLMENIKNNNIRMTDCLIQFAKLHVQNCKEDIIENVKINEYDEHRQYSPNVDKESILNSYPLENIK